MIIIKAPIAATLINSHVAPIKKPKKTCDVCKQLFNGIGKTCGPVCSEIRRYNNQQARRAARRQA